ncbi:unnamed protein product [Haemonchus placei]|uniref:Uncharacterized protein n=1 Tax=Haemonchus placei TaxID=6290 RepID=A0A0N4VUL0_HAEPC|nr:unnamed protein product [Haemonchus placei]
MHSLLEDRTLNSQDVVPYSRMCSVYKTTLLSQLIHDL